MASAPAELLAQQQQQQIEQQQQQRRQQQQAEHQQQQHQHQKGVVDAGAADAEAAIDGGTASARLLSRLSQRLQQRMLDEAAEEEWERAQKANGGETAREERQRQQALTPRGLAASLAGYRTDCAALLALLLLTALLAVGVGLESEHQWLRQAWMSCLLAPPG